MTFDEYQNKCAETAVYPRPSALAALEYTTLGLCGEAGEVADKLKKIIRDQDGNITIESRLALANELGDVLYYLTRSAAELGYNLETIAEMNVSKLQSRKARGQIQGSGDDR